MKIRSVYETHEIKGSPNGGPSKTRLDQADSCNINTMMAKAMKGIQPRVNTGQGNYGDFSNLGDYQTALNKVKNAQSIFNALPASLRDKYKNDPNELINKLPSATQEELETLGLLKRRADASASPETASAPKPSAQNAPEKTK